MTSDNALPPEVAEACKAALVAHLADDRETLTQAIGTILSYGPQSLYASLSGWLHITVEAMAPGMLQQLRDGDDMAYIEVVDDRTGKFGLLSDTDLTQPQRDLLAMLTMYLNDDHAMMIAKVRAYWEAEDGKGIVKMLSFALHLAGQAARAHMERHHTQKTAHIPLNYAAMDAAAAKFNKVKQHRDCPRALKEMMDAAEVEVTVTTLKPLVHGSYTTDPYICPHGTRYWVEPTGEQIARWTRDNTP